MHVVADLEQCLRIVKLSPDLALTTIRHSCATAISIMLQANALPPSYSI